MGGVAGGGKTARNWLTVARCLSLLALLLGSLLVFAIGPQLQPSPPLLPSPPTTPPLAAATVVVPLRVLVNEKTRSRLLFMASIIPAQWPTTLAT